MFFAFRCVIEFYTSNQSKSYVAIIKFYNLEYLKLKSFLKM